MTDPAADPPAPSPPPTTYWGTIRPRAVLSAIFLALGLLYLGIGWGEYATLLEHEAVAQWAPERCEVTEGRVTLGGEDGSPTFRVDPRYGYHHAGTEYSGTELWLHYHGHLDRTEAELLLAELLRKRHVPCWVDPDEPERAALMRHPQPNVGIRVYMQGALVLLIALQAAVWLWPSRARPRAPRQRRHAPDAGPGVSRWLVLLPVAGLLVLFLGFAYLGLRDATFGRLWTEGYELVPCRILAVRRVELVTTPDSNQFFFAYQVNGQSHRASAVGLSGSTSADIYDLPPGPAECAYPSGDPAHGFLVTGTHGPGLRQGLLSLLVAAVTAWGLVAMIRWMRA